MSDEREEAKPRLSTQKKQVASARGLGQGQACVGVLEKLKETGRYTWGSKGNAGGEAYPKDVGQDNPRAVKRL